MKYDYNNREYNIIIEKKRTTKNLYIRVKEDLNIYVTCNSFTPNSEIEKLIRNNQKAINRMIDRQTLKQSKKEEFFYLGKKYDVIRTNYGTLNFNIDKVFVNEKIDLNKWLRKEAERVFNEEFEAIYKDFPFKIPKPSLHIRSMKTRWGVCNVRDKKVTLNLELIRKEEIYLDYVIVHELCHLLEANHSKKFWDYVYYVMPDAKIIRKELKEDV